MTAVFKQINDKLACELINFTCGRNIGKSLKVGNKTYHLKAVNRSKGYKSRSIEILFTNGKSVIRIADEWEQAAAFPRSKKFNMGYGNTLLTNGGSLFHISRWAGKYPFKVAAGKAKVGLDKLKKDVVYDVDCGEFH